MRPTSLCPRCKKADRHISAGGKLASYCKDCQREMSNKKYAKHVEKTGGVLVPHNASDEQLRKALIHSRHELAKLRRMIMQSTDIETLRKAVRG